MKVVSIAAFALALCGTPNLVPALSHDDMSEEEERRLAAFLLTFEECVSLTPAECETFVENYRALNPGLFSATTGELRYVVRKKRTQNDPGYNLVGLRTTDDGTGVIGVDGDGIVDYPFPWCVPQPDTSVQCFDIGPWDCDVGIPQSPEGCCQMIKDSISDAVDVNGNHLECYTSYTPGSVNNPFDHDRIFMMVGDNNRILYPARNA